MKFYQFLFLILSSHILGFDEEVPSQEMIEKGKAQYQLLKERGTLPQYGTCWKLAIEHIHEGCKYLSEDTQSDVALHLTNCFLEMSGHEIYNCQQDRKPNLRAICINTMTDRAFNVYTEFYTHTQNICWFLRNQVWHEIITENTYKVGRQLETTSKNQEELIMSQKKSIELQEVLLERGHKLETILSELYISTEMHREILKIMTESMTNFQKWIIGEISWFDSIMFFILSLITILICTITKRTSTARFPLLFSLLINFLLERGICWIFLTTNNNNNSILEERLLYSDIISYIWYNRYFFIFLNLLYYIYKAFYYKDIIMENHKYLMKITEQNTEILKILRCTYSNINSNNDTRSNTSKMIEVIDKPIITIESTKQIDNKYLCEIDKPTKITKNNLNETMKTIDNKRNSIERNEIKRIHNGYNLRRRTCSRDCSLSKF